MSLLTNLTPYWKLDEASGTRVDSNGSNDLSEVGATINSTTGIINSAADFPGSAGQYLERASNSDLVLNGTDFTIQAWVKLTSKGAKRVILCKETAANGEYYLTYNSTADRFSFELYGNSGFGNGVTVNANTLGSPSTGVWYLVQAWLDTVGQIQGIAVNAGTADTVSNTTGVYNGTGSFKIGDDSFSEPWNGEIDEIGLWKRVLTSGERTSLYNSGAGLPYSSFASGIQFDATSNSGYQAAASSYSWSHTCTGLNLFLSVDVELLSVPGTTVSSITYNGVSLSLIGTKSSVSGAGRVECWGLVAPATGSHTIAVTLSATCISAGTAVSRTNVHQTVPTEAFNSAQATNVGAADASVSITSVADNCVIHAACASDDSSITANQTTRNNVTGAGGSGADEDTGPITPAGATTMSYTGVGALATWVIAGYAVRPIGSSGGAFLLSVTAGVFVETGGSVNLRSTRLLGIGLGTFVETGASVNLLVGRKVSSGSGSFIESGQTIRLLFARDFSCSAGSFTLTGADVGFPRGRGVQVGSGAFTLAGQSVAFGRTYILPAGSGGFTETGVSVNLIRTRVLSVASGSFTLTGQPITLTRSRSILIGSGQFLVFPSTTTNFLINGQSTGGNSNFLLLRAQQ